MHLIKFRHACSFLLVLTLLAVFLVGGVSLSAATEAGAGRKNVMLIMVDDLRPQLEGFGPLPRLHGQSLMRTPALDKLTREGTVFERAYCSVPICGASRLSLLTGSRPYKEPGQNWGRHWTYTSRLDVEDQGTPAGVNHPRVTLPQHFKNHGSGLLPMLRDPNAPWKPAVFVRYERGDSIRTARYAYTEFVSVDDEVEQAMLYDLKFDPHENDNIVAANPALQQCLRDLLGHSAQGKRNAWRALVDESRDNAPKGEPLDLPEAIHPPDYLAKLVRFRAKTAANTP